ncbi:MAG: phenylalanine--tRNA ligase subunit beta [Clostridia bacterium]|nr:phenylalanine--tRNA ligase subunit beta [Clostridia bacterium]
MKVSMNWISEYVDLSGLDIDDLIHRFTLSTAEVEDVYHYGAEINGVVVAEIKTVEEHPNSKKLHLLELDLGDRTDRCVCGAPNVRVGMRVPFAPFGASVVGMTIGEATIAGVVSRGMCCSAAELGIADSSSGLLELPADAPLGKPVKELYAFEDTVFEVDNKSLTNRPDLWGHYGIAREFSAIAKRPLKPLDIQDLSAYDALEPVPLGFIDPELCWRYSAIRADHIKKTVSPIDMRIRLYYCGMRAISLLADLTNYVMLELGQPTHAFDSRMVGTIGVQRFQEPFAFRTLDGTERKIDPETLMITSDGHPVAVAGVMGGENSEIVADTDSVTLECATFSAVSVRKTSGRIGLRTDASMRYEKTLDPELCALAAGRFLKLLLTIDPEAKVASRYTDCYQYRYPEIELHFTKAFVDRYTGIDISDAQINDTLTRLGFKVRESSSVFDVKVPSWRATKDVTIPADVIEEITRIYGYDNFRIETTMSALRPILPQQIKADEAAVKDTLVKTFGLHEVHTYLWCDAKKLNDLKIPLPENVYLLNGMNPDATVLRTAMMQTLLPVLKENRYYAPSFGVFEIGRTVKGQKADGTANERRTLGVALLSHEKERTVFLAARDMIASILFDIRRKRAAFERVEPVNAWEHPANTAAIVLDGRTIGTISTVHPEVAAEIDKKASLVTLELDMDTLSEIKDDELHYREASRFPGIDIDLSFVVDKDVTFADVTDPFLTDRDETLQNISLVDIYEAEGKSMTIRLSFVSPVKTLQKAEVQAYIDRILAVLAEKNIRLRTV